MDPSVVSSHEIVKRLWNDVRLREEVASRCTVPGLPASEQLIHAEALRYLNLHYEGRPPGPDQQGTGPRLKRRVRARLARFVIGLFADYLEEERRFNSSVVRVANSTAAGHDRLVHEIRQLAEAMRTESGRLTDEFGVVHGILEARVAALEEERPGRAT